MFRVTFAPFMTPDFWSSTGQAIRVEHTSANPFNTDVSTLQTIRQMAHLSSAQAFSAPVNAAVNEATVDLSDSASDEEIARAIFWWVKKCVVFSEDETTMHEQLGLGLEELDKELLIPPVTLLQMPVPTGDCDDFSMLGAAMLMNMRMPVAFVTVAADPAEPWKYSHVFLVTKLETGKKLYLDMSHGPYPGWKTKNVSREQEWGV